MTTIPSTIDDVDVRWLQAASGLPIAAVRPELIGVGIGVSSAVYRLHLDGDGVPPTLVLKLRALDEAAVFTSSMLRMYEREVRFFEHLVDDVSIQVPRGYGGAVSDDGSAYYVLMEDVGGHRSVDQNVGMELVDVERAIDALTTWHAAFWGKADPHVERGAAISVNDDLYHAILPMVFAEGWEKVQAEMEVHPTIADVAPRWVEAMPKMLARLATDPTTVVHGDYRADNIFFDADDQVVLLDFQITGKASGSYDLAYFVTQSLDPSLASQHERALFDRYVAGLHEHGVPADETDRLWEDYRVAALFCLVYPVVASRGMDLSDQRQYDLVDHLSRRCARAIDDLDLRELL